MTFHKSRGLILVAAAILLVNLAAAGQVKRSNLDRPRTYDVQNYIIRVSFDRAAKKVFGDTTVQFKPLAPGFRTLELDAVGMTFESVKLPGVHVLGDAIQVAPAMPKSGHMANGHAKVAAAAIVAELADGEIDPAPMLTNTCYSFVDDQRAIHVASVHEYVAAERTFKTVAGSGGLSSAPSEVEGRYGLNLARTIWADALA